MFKFRGNSGMLMEREFRLSTLDDPGVSSFDSFEPAAWQRARDPTAIFVLNIFVFKIPGSQLGEEDSTSCSKPLGTTY